MITTSSSQNSRLAPVVATIGVFLLILGLSEWAIGLADLFAGGGNSTAFFISGILTNMVGVVAVFGNTVSASGSMSMRQVLLAMISSWVMAGLFATLPFMLGAPSLSFQFAMFESISGLTTTGATVITGLDSLPKSILFWRSLLHWYGGMGVVIGALVLFPAMRIGGMQLFLRVGSETADKILPSARELGLATFSAYTLLTFICAVVYNVAGIPGFDAINLAMSTMATGGMAVSDASFANYPAIAQFMAAVFMVIAGLPLIIFVLAIRGKFNAAFKEPQIGVYLLVYALLVFALIAFRILNQQADFSTIFVDATFNTASMLTGTGFANTDFQLWGSFPTMVLFMAMFIGGCTGSTSGSVKIFRYQVLIELIRVRIRRLHYPNGIFQARYGGQKLDERVAESVAAFFMIYLTTLAVLTISFDVWGLDLLTGFSAAVSAVGNIGPGLGDKIGPVGNYASFNAGEMWTYTVAMLVGRLEFMSAMVIFLPRFWRH